MSLIDFGVKARRELANKTEQYETMRDLAQCNEALAMKYGQALANIANFTTDPISVSVARKALGRPVGGGDE